MEATTDESRVSTPRSAGMMVTVSASATRDQRGPRKLGGGVEKAADTGLDGKAITH